MSTGATLLSLKRDSKAKSDALENYLKLQREKSTLAAIFAGPMLVAGVMLFVANATFARPEFWVLGACLTTFGVMLALTALLIVTSKSDRKRARLEKDQEESMVEYLSLMLSEARSYGIDTTTMEHRTELHDSSHEFTAVRNGSPIDVSVREFNDELIFMLNGERMSKPVSV